LLLVATGGTYFDEATGMQVPVGSETAFLGLLPQGKTTAVIHSVVLAVQAAL
jgi:hypothetical protein